MERRASFGPNTPTRPLFKWAEDEALMARYDAAIKAVKDAQYHYRRAPRGKLKQREAALKRAVTHCLELEAQILNRTDHDTATKTKN